MEMARQLLPLLAFLILHLMPSNAYGKHYLYKQILLNTGLPTTLNCISSDTKGFVWTGTKFGLGRFDGHEQKDICISRATPPLSPEITFIKFWKTRPIIFGY